MKLKESRLFSFIVVAVVYILATVLAVVSFKFLTIENVYLKIFIVDVIATAFTFIFSLIFNNASVYDPYWSVQPIVIVVALALGCEITLARLLPLIAICIWGIRLTANWAYTFKNLTHQDWRYSMLKEKTGVFYPLINFLGIHLFPTIVVYLCMLPVIYTFTIEFNVNAGSIIFFAVSILATLLQGTADVQMHVFRKQAKGGFIRFGLWKYSRHPNYLGEILMWWGIALALVCAKPTVWHLCIGALVNNLMFLVVSIPMADKRQSKKQGFVEYKKATRILLPVKKF